MGIDPDTVVYLVLDSLLYRDCSFCHETVLRTVFNFSSRPNIVRDFPFMQGKVYVVNDYEITCFTAKNTGFPIFSGQQ